MPPVDKPTTETRTGRPSGPAGGPDERREAILAAACRAILGRGFHATRIADIAREAGTSSGTVHYHFETKDDVLTAALRWANEQPYVRMDRLLGQDADEVTRLATLLELSVPYEGVPREEWIVFLELWGRLLHRPDLLPDGEDLESRWRGYFFDLVRSGTARGVFHPPAGADEAADRLVAMVDGLGLKAVLGLPAMPPARMREILFRFAAEKLAVPYADLDRRARGG